MALGHALKDPRGRGRILADEPSAERAHEDTARRTLEQFLSRAFRRPASDEEVADYLALFAANLEQTGTFDAALQLTLEAILVSPKFLFLWEQPAPQATLNR